MIEYDKDHPVFSVHVPKTGGTSLKKVLQSWFGENSVHFHYHNEIKNRPPRKAELKRSWFTRRPKVLCIHGHFNPKRNTGISDYYPESKFQCISFLRDPLEIALSNYFFYRKKEQLGTAYKHGKKHPGFKDINEFLMNHVSFIPLYLPGFPCTEPVEEIIHKRYVHIGLMENFQQSVDLMAAKLGKKTIVVDHENPSERDEEPDDKAIEMFRKNNAVAYRIYDFVKSLNV